MESTKEEMLNYLNKLADYCIPMDGGKMRMTSQVWAIVAARDAAIRADERQKAAERAMEAVGNIPPFRRGEWELLVSRIRAAIMSEPEEGMK